MSYLLIFMHIVDTAVAFHNQANLVAQGTPSAADLAMFQSVIASTPQRVFSEMNVNVTPPQLPEEFPTAEDPEV